MYRSMTIIALNKQRNRVFADLKKCCNGNDKDKYLDMTIYTWITILQEICLVGRLNIDILIWTISILKAIWRLLYGSQLSTYRIYVDQFVIRDFWLILKFNKSTVDLFININALWENLSNTRDIELTSLRDAWSHVINVFPVNVICHTSGKSALMNQLRTSTL